MELSDRMKQYEDQWRSKLPRKRFVIVRVDGDNFHALGRHFRKPFDGEFHKLIEDAALMTASRMQGFLVAYVQSDEASFLLTDDMSEEAQGWFDYQVNKIVSTASGMMSAYFNRLLAMRTVVASLEKDDHWRERFNHSPPTFDARAFDLPDDEVINYFYWRALDWHRNSLQMLSRSHFSQKQLQGKSQIAMHEMLHQGGWNWVSDTERWMRNGTFIRREPEPDGGSITTISDDLYHRQAIADFICKAGNERVRARLQSNSN